MALRVLETLQLRALSPLRALMVHIALKTSMSLGGHLRHGGTYDT